MRVRRSPSLLPLMMTTMMTMVLLDSTNCEFTNSRGDWRLPAPRRVSMESVDMRHVLRWRPLQAPCNTTVLYSVQFQGEFELTVLNGSWVEAPECRRTPRAHCDLSLDLGSDSDYNLRVRARCGPRLSPWTELRPPFNRRHTVLTAPHMSVTAVGDALQVSFGKLPLTAAVSVTVRRKGDQQESVVYTMPAEQTTLHVAALQEGEVYCVSARTVLDPELHSSSTDTQCVSITGPDAPWRRPTTVTVAVVVVVSAGLLFAVFWSVVHCRPDACRAYFHKEPLPRSLESDWDTRVPMRPEEAELCEPIHVPEEAGLVQEEAELYVPMRPEEAELVPEGAELCVPMRPEEAELCEPVHVLASGDYLCQHVETPRH